MLHVFPTFTSCFHLPQKMAFLKRKTNALWQTTQHANTMYCTLSIVQFHSPGWLHECTHNIPLSFALLLTSTCKYEQLHPYNTNHSITSSTLISRTSHKTGPYSWSKSHNYMGRGPPWKWLCLPHKMGGRKASKAILQHLPPLKFRKSWLVPLILFLIEKIPDGHLVHSKCNTWFWIPLSAPINY